MSGEWKNLVNVSVWVSPYDVFKPVFIETYGDNKFLVRIFDRVPVAEQHYGSFSQAISFACLNQRELVEEDVRPLARIDGKDIPTGQIFEYWYKTDAATPYYVIINISPGEKISVQSLMGDDKPLFLFDTYEQARIALWQDIYQRVDELDLSAIPGKV